MAEASSRFRDLVEDVRSRTNLVDLIASDGHNLERTGSDYKCLSPFRKERTPSFWIYDKDQRYYDFGTADRGDCFNYVQQRDGCDFKTALGVLAARLGIVPYWEENGFSGSEEHDKEIRELVERYKVQDILTTVAEICHKSLPDKIRESYYKKIYGLTDETIDQLKLGWADGDVAETLLERGYSKTLLLKTGLFIQQGERLIDFFDRRLLMPYWRRGKVVYFIGRRTELTSDAEYEKGKYKKLLTSSDKHPYVSPSIRNDHFFNEDVCDKPQEYIVLTEGIMDAAAAKQAGIPCISPVTTRPKTSQYERLDVLTERIKKIYISNDADVLEDGRKPGEEGALAMALHLFRIGRDVYIVSLPRPEGVSKIDLCDYLRDYGKESYFELVKQAKRYPEYLIDQIPDGLDPAELEKRLEPMFQLIAACKPIEREEYIKRVSKRFGISKKTVEKKLSPYRSKEEEKLKSDDDKSLNGQRQSQRPPASGSRVRGQVCDEAYYYYVRTPNGIDETISSFAIYPKVRLVVDGKELIYGDVCTGSRTIGDFTFHSNAWTSRRDFIRAIQAYPDLQWMGSDENVQGVLAIASAVLVPKRIGTTNLGYCEEPNGPRWVFRGGTISPDGIMADPDVVYCGDSLLASRLLYESTTPEELTDLAKAVLPRLLDLNDESFILPVLSWFFAVPFKPRVAKILGHFPILMVHGSQGSGKTSVLRDIFWPLFGVAKITEPYSCTETDFAMFNNLSSSNSISTVIDEYRPRDMGKTKVDRIHRLLRRVYGGEIEQRGRPNLTLVNYCLEIPVAMAGEAAPEDSALCERMILVLASKNAISDPARQKAFATIRRLPLHKMALPFVQWSLTQDVQSRISEAKRVAERTLKVNNISVSSPRIFDSLTVVVFGALMFDAWCASLGVECKQEPNWNNVFRAVLGECVQDGGVEFIKDAFDAFLEQLSVYEHKGLLKDGTEYTIVDGKLRLHLASCYEVYLTERQRTGREDETNGLRALQHLAKEKEERRGSNKGSYVLNASKRTDMKKMGADDRYQIRCVEIDQDRIPPSLEFKAFGRGSPLQPRTASVN